MRFLQHYFTEAFSEQDLTKAIGLIKSYLEKKVGPLSQERGLDYFQNKLGKGVGIRYFTKDDKSIRFDFAGNKEIIAVDIWNGTTKDPNVRIDTKGLSVVKILPLIVDELKNTKTGTFEVDLTGEEPVKTAGTTPAIVSTEAVSVKIGDKVYDKQKDAIKDLLQAGKSSADIQKLTGAKPSSIYVVKKELGIIKDVKVFEAGPEKNADPTLPALEQELNGIEYADVETIFQDLEMLVDMVGKGKIFSLLVTGMPGVGKTVTSMLKLETTLGEKGKDWLYHKGRISPLGLYRILFEDNGKTIVIDEADNALEEEQSIIILKAALDNKKEREVEWNTESKTMFSPKGLSDEEIDTLVSDGKLPKQFMFTGRIIFISNMYQDKIDSAIRSRSYHIDVTLRKKDVVVRIRQLMDKIHPEISKSAKEDVLSFMETNAHKMRAAFDIRTFDKSLEIYGLPNWERLILKYV